MDIFDLLVENQISSWQQRKAEEKIKPVKNTRKTTVSSSFESQILHDIENIYVEMATFEPAQRQWQQLDKKATDLKSHLMITMERQGLFITSSNISKNLAKKRQAILGQ